MHTVSNATTRSRLAWRSVPGRGRPPAALLAVAVLVGLLALVPVAYLAFRALEGGLGEASPLFRERTGELVASTAVLGLAVALGSVGLGVPLAWLTSRTDLPARRAWSVLAIAPLAIPSYLLAFAYVGALAPRGWLGGLLRELPGGTSPSPYGFAGAVLVLTLATVPYVVISTRAVLARLDASTEQAARSLGDGPWAAARTAVLPVVLPAIGAGALLASLYAISDFGAVSILRYDTLATAIYSQYRFSFDRSGAATLALLLLALALFVVWAEGRVRRRAALRTPHGQHSPWAVVRLGRWRWPALAFCVLMASLALGVPSVTIATWLLNGLARGLPMSVAWDALGDSILLASGAAFMALLMAVPLAWLVVRYPGPAGTATERLLYLVYAIPGISFALAVAFLNLSVLPVLYQTLFVLVLAIALRYVIQAVGGLRGPVLQISPRMGEAARSLGEGPGGVVRTITLPLLRPGLVAGALLVFLSALKELPLTLLLAPPGFSTLATELWDAAREAFYAQAAVPAVLLLLVSFVTVGLLVRRGEITT